MSASKKVDGLSINHYVKKNGTEVYEVFLPGKRNRYIRLNPYGVIHTQAPNEEIIHIMFSLAKELNANVYNENFKKFSSYEDWDRKTRHARKLAAIEEKEEKKEALKKRCILAIIIATSFYIGWLLSEYKII